MTISTNLFSKEKYKKTLKLFFSYSKYLSLSLKFSNYALTVRQCKNGNLHLCNFYPENFEDFLIKVRKMEDF